MDKVLNLDHQARGIIKPDGKITFVKNALPGEIIEYKIIKETKKYNLGQLTNIIQKSPPSCRFYVSVFTQIWGMYYSPYGLLKHSKL